MLSVALLFILVFSVMFSHLNAMGWSLVLLAGSQVVVSGISRLCPILRLTRLKMSETILT